MAKRKSQNKKKRIGRPPPTCKAILLCDRVIQEQGTGKVSIIGIFGQFYVESVPGLTSSSTAYLMLTNGAGEYSITVEIHDLEHDKILGRAEGMQIKFPTPDKLSMVNLIVPLPPLPIQHLGHYDVVVLCEDGEIDRQQFEVIPPPSEEADDLE